MHHRIIFCSLNSNDDDYRMDYAEKRGVFIIINNSKFMRSTQLEDLPGYDRDAARLYELFSVLDFEVRMIYNQTTKKMTTLLNNGKGVCCS